MTHALVFAALSLIMVLLALYGMVKEHYFDLRAEMYGAMSLVTGLSADRVSEFRQAALASSQRKDAMRSANVSLFSSAVATALLAIVFYCSSLTP